MSTHSVTFHITYELDDCNTGEGDLSREHFQEVLSSLASIAPISAFNIDYESEWIKNSRQKELK